MERDDNSAIYTTSSLHLTDPLLRNISDLPTFAAVIVADMLDGIPNNLLVVNVGLKIYKIAL